jgi:hypothetical protein
VYAKQSGVYPYMAAVYPLEGLVPNGSVLGSPDDGSMSSTVLSRWPDGSAAVVVVAGTVSASGSGTTSLRLQSVAASGTALTAARIGQLVSNVTVNCGALGTASLSSFGSPEKLWWANAQVVCARYRVPVGSDATLEAVIDIHAFAANRAFVEVVLENGKINPGNPTLPASKSYTATVSVNGSTVTTVTAPSGQVSSHNSYRAWYASTWVGGDPGVVVTQDAAVMQAHPLMMRMFKTGQGNVSQYAADAYVPFRVGRWPASGMGGGGAADQIGPFPRWEAHYLQTGAREAANAVVQNALGVLTYPITYRSMSTGLVCTMAELSGKRLSEGTLPGGLNRDEPFFEQAHHGAAGLLAFMCRPSPVFIEIAQKIATWCVTAMSTNGVLGMENYQPRGIGWTLRSLAHAAFLTPDGEPWKASARSVLYANVQHLTGLKNSRTNQLGLLYDEVDFESGQAGRQIPTFMLPYLAYGICTAANAKLLSGSQQNELNALANASVEFFVRFVNDATAGEWRAIGASRMTVSTDANSFVQTNWSALASAVYTGEAKPPSGGPWLEGRGVTRYSDLFAMVGTNTAGANYSSYFWNGLVLAVERDIPGAAAAWSKVTSPTVGITNLAEWSSGFVEYPTFGSYPRNKS